MIQLGQQQKREALDAFMANASETVIDEDDDDEEEDEEGKEMEGNWLN